MSGNAALAAAKRRRNPATAPEATNRTTSQLEGTPRKPQSVPELLANHDLKIFLMEKRVAELKPNNNIEDTIATANNAENLAKNNIIEIKLLKSTVTKQGKALQDAQSLLTTLRAALNTQTAELNRLKSQKEVPTFNNSKDDVGNDKDEDTADSDDSDNDKVELNVSEK